MRLSALAVLTMVLPVVAAFAFPIMGRWAPVNHTDISVVVADGHVCGSMLRSGAAIRMDADHKDGGKRVRLTNPRVLRQPSDWYNVVKYAPFIRAYQQVKADGVVECGVDLVGDGTAVVDFLLANQSHVFVLQNTDHL